MWCPMMAGTLVVDKGRGGFGVRISVVGSNSVLVAPRGERKDRPLIRVFHARLSSMPGTD